MIYINGSPRRCWRVVRWRGRWLLVWAWGVLRITPADAANILDLVRRGTQVNLETKR